MRDHLESTGLTALEVQASNPVAHAAVKRYLKGVTEEQLQARATPKQAEPLFISDLLTLCQVIDNKLRMAGNNPIHIYIHARDLAYFKLHFFFLALGHRT